MRKRILLVDDSPVVLTQLSDEFAEDYDVITAESGEEAVEILEDPIRGDVCFSNQFDLIITDLLMPGMSGLDLADYVRKRNRVNSYTPVILLTTEKISKDEARRHGCSAYFSKADKKRLIAMATILLSF
jgi:CheY-like chemotaxis protein